MVICYSCLRRHQAESDFQFEGSQQHDPSLTFGATVYRQYVIDSKRFAEYMLERYDSWFTFGAELGHELPQSGLLFVVGCDKTSCLMCAASVNSDNSVELKFFTFVSLPKDSANFWECWRSVRSLAMTVGLQRPASQSMLSYAVSFLSDAVMAAKFAMQWPSDRRGISDVNKCIFLRVFPVEEKLLWIHSKLFVPPGDGDTAISRDMFIIFKTREGAVVQGENFDPALLSSSSGSEYPQSGASRSNTQTPHHDDDILCMPQTTELDDELAGVLSDLRRASESSGS